MEDTYLNIITAVYKKPTANFILIRERLETVQLRSGIRQGWLLSPLLFSIALKALDGTVMQEENQRATNGKKMSNCPYLQIIELIKILPENF